MSTIKDNKKLSQKSIFKIKPWVVLLAVCLSAVVLLLLAQLTNLDTLIASFVNLHFSIIFIALSFMVLSYFTRTLRLAIYLGLGKKSLLRLFYVTVLHNSANRLFPLRMGEIVLPWLLLRWFQQGLGGGFGGLVLMRLLDLFTLMILLALAIIVSGISMSFYSILLTVSMGGAILVVIVVEFEQIIHLLLKSINAIDKKMQGKYFLLDKIAKQILDAQQSAKRMGAWQARAGLLLTTVLTWFGIFGFYWVLMKSYGQDIWQVIIGSSVASLAGVLPLSGIGTFGSHEAGWTAGFSLVGLDSQQAVATGIMSNALGFVLALGLALLVLLISFVVEYLGRSSLTLANKSK